MEIKMAHQYTFKTKKSRLSAGLGLIAIAILSIFLIPYIGLYTKDKQLLFLVLFLGYSSVVIIAIIGLIFTGIESAEEAKKEKDLELAEIKKDLQDNLANLDPLTIFSTTELIDQFKTFRLFINEYHLPLHVKEVKPLLRFTANLLKLVYENLNSTEKLILDEIKYKREQRELNEINNENEEWENIIIKIRFHREEVFKIKKALHRFYDHLEELAKENGIEIITHGSTKAGYLTYADPVKPVK